jgi:streptomycin 6-kinase
MRDLDRRVNRAVESWSLTLGEPYPDVFPGNFVCRCSLPDGTRAVIKTEPDSERGHADEFVSGIDAMLLYDGHGMARVLKFARQDRVVLMENVEPGDTMWHEPIDQALEAVASVMRKLQKAPPPDHSLPDVRAYKRAWPTHVRLYFGPGPIDADLFQMGERLFVEMCDTSAAPVVLHGDLHFGNVLRSEREPWLAIDPKGVIGEPCYEVGDVFRNRVDELLEAPDPARAMRRRVEMVADLTGFDRERIRLWALAQAVLSAIWTADDPDPSRAANVDMRAARLLKQIGPIG